MFRFLSTPWGILLCLSAIGFGAVQTLTPVSYLKGGTAGRVLTDNGTSATWSNSISTSAVPSLDASKIGTGTLPAARLGAGAASASTYLGGDSIWHALSDLSPALGGDLAGTVGAATVAKINGAALGDTTATSGRMLVGQGSNWVSRPLSGDGALDAAGAFTLATSNSSPGTYGAAGNSLTAAVDGKGRVTSLSSQPISIGASQVGSGVLGVARGGTGLSSYASGDMLFGSGGSLASLGVGVSGRMLYSSGSAPAWTGAGLQWDATNGFLGIGGAPSTYLHVSDGSVPATSAIIPGRPSAFVSANGFAESRLDVASSTPSTRPLTIMLRSRGSVSAPAAVQSGDFIGTVITLAYDGANYLTGTRIDAVVDGPVTTGSVPQRLSFFTGASATPTESLRLDYLQNVVINPRGAGLATSSTDGFLYLPSMAGYPTGTPTTYTGATPLVIDTTSQATWQRNGAQWTVLSGGWQEYTSGMTTSLTVIDGVTGFRIVASSGQTVTLTLPNPAKYKGKAIYMKKNGSGTVAINSENYTAVGIYIWISDGASWWSQAGTAGGGGAATS